MNIKIIHENDLNKQTVIKLINKLSSQFKLQRMTYDSEAFIEPPRKSGEGLKILIDTWVIPKDKQEEIIKYFQELDYQCRFVHREWGTYIMVSE
jgi:hypothetical protein